MDSRDGPVPRGRSVTGDTKDKSVTRSMSMETVTGFIKQGDPAQGNRIPKPTEPNITSKNYNYPKGFIARDERVEIIKLQNEITYEPIIYRGDRENGFDYGHQYIFTGQSIGVPKEMYIRVSDLQAHLSDNTRYEEDWQELQKEKSDHFPVWNIYGDLCSSVKFLREVYGIAEGSAIPLPELGYDRKHKAFQTFCDIAHAAECAPKDPWSVLARFWDGDAPDVTLIIEPMEGLEKAVKLALQTMREDTESRRKFRPICRLSTDCTLQPDQKQLVKKDNIFSAHPRGYYTTYISSTDRAKIKNKKDARPNDKGTLVNRVTEVNKLFNVGKAEGTDTLITAETVGTASQNPKRQMTQQQVMSNVSATEVAKIMWNLKDEDEDLKRAAEWLHRSAYSFGGLMDERPLVSSQQRKNLIFGTYETNTAMIRYEAYIKTAVTYTEKRVRLTTELCQSDILEKLKGNVDWYADGLTYIVKEGLFKEDCWQVDFNPFGRDVPTRFEVELDRLVDQEYYELQSLWKLESRKATVGNN